LSEDAAYDAEDFQKLLFSAKKNIRDVRT